MDKLPLGISFYTFQIAAYIIDVYWGRVPVEKSFIQLGTYLTMFPQLIAGPIINYSEVRMDLCSRTVTFEQFESGLKTLILGLGAKVIVADRIGLLWNNIQAIGFESISTPLAWMGAFAYSIELYFDFSGYSLMALGLGRTKKGQPNGGITVSGGEPLLQIDFVTEFFSIAKAHGVHTTLDSCGSAFSRKEPFFSKFQKLMEVTDLVMLDLKQTDSEKHKELTGRDNANILDMARYLSEIRKPMWIRRVLVPGLTDDPAELQQLKDFIDSLSSVEKVEILPYHTLGLFKWQNLGIEYPLEGVPVPTPEQVQQAETILGIAK